MSIVDLRRYRAERLLRGEFVARRSKVLAIVRSRLRAKGVSLDPLDLDACYSQAWHGLYAALLAGEQVENTAGWLVLVTFRRALDEARSNAHLRVSLDGGGQDVGAPQVRSLTPDMASTLDDRERLRQVFEGLRGRLAPREREAASLCYLHGLPRAAAARQMGISEARMRKLMDGTGPGNPGVAGKVARLLEAVEGGRWCEQQSSLIRAYALGLLDAEGERHALAAAHCRECPGCRAQVALLRGIAAFAPPPSLVMALLQGSAGSRAGTGSKTGTGFRAATDSRARAGTRPLSGATVRPGLGVGGPMASKLAVIGAVGLLGGSMALGGAHRSTHAPLENAGRPVVGTARPASSAVSPLDTFASAGKRRKRAEPKRVARAHPRPRSTDHRGSSGRHRLSERASTNAAEFGPERASGEQGPAGAGTAAPESTASHSAREFGL